ncbi:uncharacterized protein FIBRA_04971 [Fibroporia radiculosa]|uniref:Telomere length regulation protein conserved domain-containing protein n=1 Tax=Fibroporia radiculosa TaxID=599839 RepID=J4H390_9APHY|nr:uncharacterized protein FIBRA_04971 [Fibroporia radiculosa]CCM02859.1 predicted protein [Fibroporia radiculosa]
MSAEFHDSAIEQIRVIITRLQSPVPDATTLYQLLAAPLAYLNLLPPKFRGYNESPLIAGSFIISRHLPPLQRALLEHVLPTWEASLVEGDTWALAEQYFCPDSISFASSAAGQVAVHAYSSILSLPFTDVSLRLLDKLSRSYPIDVLHSVVYSIDGRKGSSGKQIITWEDCVRNVAAIPAKASNMMGGGTVIPSSLEQGTYLKNLSVRCECLIYALSRSPSREYVSSIVYLLTKLVNIGLFTHSRLASLSQPAFFEVTLPVVRTRLSYPDESYAEFWQQIILSLPSYQTRHSIILSLLSSLAEISPSLDTSTSARSLVKREAQLLKGLLGRLDTDNGEVLDAFSAIALGREWSEGRARIFACWAAGAESSTADIEGLESVLSRVVDMWTSPEHIKHSLLSRHHYITALLLLTLNSFRPIESRHCQKLALSPPFITSISTYISHLDPSVRRCGMLVGEEVASGAGKKLDFGDWDGEDQGKVWCRQLRLLISERDADAETISFESDAKGATPDQNTSDEHDAADQAPVHSGTSGHPPRLAVMEDVQYDSDDSLTGYASTPSSSRSSSPTPSELAEIEKDPTLRVGQKKIPRPVYLAQLGQLVRSTSGLRTEGEEMQVEKIEMALEVAEELIRRKRAYGSELEENAINLVHGFIGLQDNYEIADFDERRQAALNALVACCPRKAAPTLIEEFFRNQYSTTQRYVMLNALAVGTGELASISFGTSSTARPLPANRISFPSRQLPPAQHKKYITGGDHTNAHNPVQKFLEDISRDALDKGQEATADKVPQFVRERQLRIRQPAKVTEVKPSGSALTRLGTQAQPKSTTFTEVAAEFFICPLINRFWLFLRDEQTREERTMRQPALHQYKGAGTGLILNAVVLSRFLSTLTVLVHAARNAREWLAIVAPDSLELAVTIGTRPVSMAEGEDEDEDEDTESSPEKSSNAGTRRRGKEAAVLTAALELALIVLDGCLDLDGGRSLGLEHTALLLGAGQWAGEVFSRLDKGSRVLGEGGIHEVKLRRAAAGVVLKVDELTSKWRRSMVDVGSF